MEFIFVCVIVSSKFADNANTYLYEVSIIIIINPSVSKQTFDGYFFFLQSIKQKIKRAKRERVPRIFTSKKNRPVILARTHKETITHKHTLKQIPKRCQNSTFFSCPDMQINNTISPAQESTPTNYRAVGIIKGINTMQSNYNDP